MQLLHDTETPAPLLRAGAARVEPRYAIVRPDGDGTVERAATESTPVPVPATPSRWSSRCPSFAAPPPAAAAPAPAALAAPPVPAAGEALPLPPLDPAP